MNRQKMTRLDFNPIFTGELQRDSSTQTTTNTSRIYKFEQN